MNGRSFLVFILIVAALFLVALTAVSADDTLTVEAPVIEVPLG